MAGISELESIHSKADASSANKVNADPTSLFFLPPRDTAQLDHKPVWTATLPSAARAACQTSQQAGVAAFLPPNPRSGGRAQPSSAHLAYGLSNPIHSGNAGLLPEPVMSSYVNCIWLTFARQEAGHHRHVAERQPKPIDSRSCWANFIPAMMRWVSMHV